MVQEACVSGLLRSWSLTLDGDFLTLLTRLDVESSPEVCWLHTLHNLQPDAREDSVHVSVGTLWMCAQIEIENFSGNHAALLTLGTCVASFPRLPHFWFAFSIIHRSVRVAKNGEGLGIPIHEWGGGGVVPNYKFVCNKTYRGSFLPVKLSTVDLVNVWVPDYRWSAQWWSLAHLFECGPFSPHVHLVSTRRHSHDRCSQALFRCSSTSVYYIGWKPKNKKMGGGLGTRLVHVYIKHS